MTTALKLNIGAGQTYLPGFRNVDIVPFAEIPLDLNRDRLPFEDGSVDLVFSHHCLEHLDNYLFALGEIHRVLKHRGRFLLGVPYVTLTEYNLVNPYHRQHFNEYSFDFFALDGLKGSASEENPVLFKKVFHRFHYMRPFTVLPRRIKDFCRRHLFNVVRAIDFGLLAIKPPSTGIELEADEDEKLVRLFDECLQARIPYEENVWQGLRHS